MIDVVDLFCGAGGTSTGIIKAAADLGLSLRLTAVNHWQTAINTHSLNHPQVRHICEPVENLVPDRIIPSRRLRKLAASCECRFHSNARGGGPCDEQSRSQPWQIIRWATEIRVETILMENVVEWMHWGPLHPRTHRPLKSRRGEYFRNFMQTLENIGYHPEVRVQVAADFGDPTSRKRLMLIAHLGRKVQWPDPSHGPGRAQPWGTARQCIDWELKGKSIFGRKKPLCANTLGRIESGLKKFGGAAAEPFLIMLRGTSENQVRGSARSLGDPLPTLTAGGGHACLVEPFLVHVTHQGNRPGHSIDKPLPTITCARRGEIALVEPFLMKYHGNHSGKTDGKSRLHRLADPLPTQDGSNRFAVVEPMIIKYYKTGRCQPVASPLDTVTTKARFALVEFASGEMAELDIRTRMLQPHELAKAHSFPGDYKLTGNKDDQVRQVGNSVPVELARAHARAALI
jgi:DNA (cytosine-5)-methyltransferase 1